MKAVVISPEGGIETLTIQDRPITRVQADEVRIEVYAAGVNRPDLFQVKGNYPAPSWVAADIPGLEVAGVVAEVGENVLQWKVGDKVCALVAGAGYAAYVTVNEGHCLAIPTGYSFEEAACIPENIFTVYSNVFQRANLQPQEAILIYGGAGGIGSTAIQLAKIIGCKVYTTAGNNEKIAFCKSLGADVVLNYRTDDLLASLKGEPIDVILDSIGGNYFPINMKLLAEEGRLVYINATAGGKVELNIFQLMQKRIHLSGSTLRARDNAFKTALRDALVAFDKAYDLFAKYKPAVYASYPLENVQEALFQLQNGDVMGKIVLTLK